MTTGRAGEMMATLPEEVLTVIRNVVRDNPSKDFAVLASQAISTLAGTGRLNEMMKSFESPVAFVQAVFEEVRRLKG